MGGLVISFLYVGWVYTCNYIMGGLVISFMGGLVITKQNIYQATHNNLTKYEDKLGFD
jgi:REP element-mobilizing transposase RayT